ncbi:MAG: penicillin-binding protein 2 [Candidatus Omnitrophica bacterium]|nr:penicillin-binding protein 2 [Candidatus Omnitrophota bacterium]
MVRAVRLSFLAALGFGVIFLNLVRMQILQSDHYSSLSEKNRIRVIYLEGPRGKILDRKGRALADNRLSFNCSASLQEARRNIYKSCGVLRQILGESPGVLERRFLEKKKPGVFNAVLLAEDISLEKATAVEERLDALPGIMIETKPQRVYPLKEAGAHALGFIGPLTPEEVERLESYDYRRADWIGREGVEAVYESYLRGRSGGLQIEVDNRGRFVKLMGVKEPREGKDVQLCLDGALQTYVQNLLQGQKGAVLVMDLSDGGLLAMNSSPAFDPNLFASSRGRKDVGRFLHDRDSPMINRGIRGQYPPGSIFKVVTALAALEHRKLTSDTAFECDGSKVIGGNRFHCWKAEGHGAQRMTEGFAHSCNVYFYAVGLTAGIDAVTAQAAEFGFSKITGVDAPGEKPGFVPTREWKKLTRGQAWYDGETANIAIGQGSLQVTPIQALVMVSAIATKGELLKPHVIDKIEGISVAERHTKHVIALPRHWRSLQEGLDAVINSESGTGKLARVPGLHIAGKTGTAQSGQEKTHAWFVGFAPFEQPKIAMVVFLEQGGRGGVSAATMAAAIFQWLKEASYL